MATFVRVSVLLWADVLAGYAMWVMVNYLTKVWKLSFTHASGIVNIWGGISSIMPIGFTFLVDTFMGDYWMLLLSSSAYSIGLGFLFLSTPSILSNATGTCSKYEPECIGHTQQVLFYTALALTAIGISGHLVSLESYVKEQTSSKTRNEKKGWKILLQLPGIVLVVLVPLIGAIALPYIKPWSIRFGIPAICTLVATLLFLSGSWSYSPSNDPQGSPLTTVFRVSVAFASKIFHRLPSDASQLYGSENPQLPHTRSLRCLDKAAIILPIPTRQEQEQNRWRLCTMTEVEEIKTGIRMIPICLTFIISGVVISIGNTYFLEQANDMNPKVGHLKVPLPFFLFLYEMSKSFFAKLYNKMASFLAESELRHYAPPIGFAVAMIFSIFCCIIAAKIETQRLAVIKNHGLLDKPNEKIPMSRFALLPQFFLLAALDKISEKSIAGFFTGQAPTSMKKYLDFFAKGVVGLGIMGSVLSVYIVGKVSGKGGKASWFQYTLNKSRLDNYYWTLAALSAVNLVIYIFLACFYSYRKSEGGDEELAENGPASQPYEDKQCCCCFG